MSDTPESPSNQSSACNQAGAPAGERAGERGWAAAHRPTGQGPSSSQAAEHSTVADQSRSLAPSDSPCVAICSTLYDEICRGCGRTAMEVANWVFLSEEERLAVWARIKAQGYPRR